jgi:hypothetical protein
MECQPAVKKLVVVVPIVTTDDDTLMWTVLKPPMFKAVAFEAAMGKTHIHVIPIAMSEVVAVANADRKAKLLGLRGSRPGQRNCTGGYQPQHDRSHSSLLLLSCASDPILSHLSVFPVPSNLPPPATTSATVPSAIERRLGALTRAVQGKLD